MLAGEKRGRARSSPVHNSFRHAANQCDAGVESSCFQETHTHTHTHAHTERFSFPFFFFYFSFFLLLFLLLLYSLHPREGEIGHDGRDGCVSAGCLSIGITYDCRRTGKETSVDDSVKGSRGWGGRKLEYRKG